MYEQLELILGRTLNGFEYQKLEELKEIYKEEQIIKAFKNSSVKNMNYIVKVLANTKEVPKWMEEEHQSEKVNFKDFIFLLKEWKGFFGTDTEYKEWINKQCKEYEPTKEQLEEIRKEII